MIDKFYTARYDRVFKTIFCNEDDTSMMKTLLSSILERNIVELEFLRNELDIKDIYDKCKTVDVLVLVDNEYIHIELNIVNNQDYIHLRNYIYFSEVFSKKTKRGNKYDYKTKFLHIDISFGIKGDRVNEYYIMDRNGKKYVNNIKIIEYNIDKIKSTCYNENELRKYKYLRMLDSNLEELEILSKGDEFVMEYKNKLKELNEDLTFRSAISWEEDYELRKNTEKEISYEEGIEKGIEEGKKEIIYRLNEKNYSLKDISEIIGISEQEIEKILNNIP